MADSKSHWNVYTENVLGTLLDPIRNAWDAMSPLQQVSIATAPVPVVGDVTGLLADLEMYSEDPESRSLGNYALTGMGLLPFVPSVSGVIKTRKIGEENFDPRYDRRVKEQERIRQTTTEMDLREAPDVPEISIANLEGMPFITSMSDRTAAGGLLTKIDDVELANPVNLQGGQGYMFENPGQVWASAELPVKQIINRARLMKYETGQDPLYLPWRMAPTGGDFATMTGETMLSYASSAMGKGKKRSLDSKIKKNFIPDWKGVDDPASIEQFRNASADTRKNMKNFLDVNFRDEGGLNIGQARLAVSDPAQTAAREGGLMNIGEIFSEQPIIRESGHPSYPFGIPGQGRGRLAEDISVFELLPETVLERGIPNPSAPRQTDLRALQMKPYSGIITEEILKNLEMKGLLGQ